MHNFFSFISTYPGAISEKQAGKSGQRFEKLKAYTGLLGRALNYGRVSSG